MIRAKPALRERPLYDIVIHMSTKSADPSTTSVLSVRVSARERALLKEASEQARTSLSDFVRGKALEAAEIEVLERIVVVISASDWEKVEAWMDRPAEMIPGLKKLARKAATWQR